MPSLPLTSRRIRISGLAQTDLAGIGTYTQNRWGNEQKTRYLHQIQKTLLTLLDAPQTGTERDDIAPGLRSRASGSHIVFYRITDFGLEVVRVLHHRMDARQHFA